PATPRTSAISCSRSPGPRASGSLRIMSEPEARGPEEDESAPAAPRLLAATARAGAHAAEDPAVLHLAEMHADIGAGRLPGQLELVGLETADLVTDAGGLLELEVGRGIAHALLQLGDVRAQVVADQMNVARHAGIDRVMVTLGRRLQDLGDVL